jgi:hypothetical protein
MVTPKCCPREGLTRARLATPARIALVTFSLARSAWAAALRSLPPSPTALASSASRKSISCPALAARAASLNRSASSRSARSPRAGHCRRSWPWRRAAPHAAEICTHLEFGDSCSGQSLRSRPLVGGLLVGVRLQSPVPGSAGVRQGLGVTPDRRGGGEVMGELGQTGPGRVPVASLDRVAEPPVQLHPSRDGKPLVDHLSHQRVAETVPAADHARLLGHDTEIGGLRERTENVLHRKVEGGPEQRQVEGPGPPPPRLRGPGRRPRRAGRAACRSRPARSRVRQP